MNGAPASPSAAAGLEIRDVCGLTTTIFKVAAPVPDPFVAPKETVKVPDAVDAPVIQPVVMLRESPAGNPAAAKLVGALLAVIR